MLSGQTSGLNKAWKLSQWHSTGPPCPRIASDRRHPLERVIHGVARCHHSVLARRTFMVKAVLARGGPKLTFECATEGRFRLVSHFAGNFRDTPRRILKRPRSQLKSPASQIRHGWLGKIPGKTLHESSP